MPVRAIVTAENMQMRALVLAPFEPSALARLRRRLDSVVHESWLDTRRLHDPEELGRRLAGGAFEILVVEADFVFEETFELAPQLRLVGVCRNALNHVDLEAAVTHGVVVTHASGRNTNAVAEMSIALMLSLARRIPQAHAVVSGAGWRDPTLGYRALRGREVAGSTVGVLGFGQIGREVARLAAALGAHVLAHDRFVSDSDIVARGARPVSLDELLAESDFVTLHVAENESTVRMVDAGFLEAMRPGAYLVNTSGGAVVDPAALAEALGAGRIAGAALDVFEGHPLPPSSPLCTAPNLILTPHIGGATEETVARHSLMMADEIERFLDGEPLRHAITPGPARAG
jgi:phosphoglycerate dehydrogenase-like enzyme